MALLRFPRALSNIMHARPTSAITGKVSMKTTTKRSETSSIVKRWQIFQFRVQPHLALKNLRQSYMGLRGPQM